MTVTEATKLIDLFLDDELPMELASEFKQVMFENDDLREEVASLRQTKECLTGAYEGDGMTDVERMRVLSRILAETGVVRVDSLGARWRQLALPLTDSRKLGG